MVIQNNDEKKLKEYLRKFANKNISKKWKNLYKILTKFPEHANNIVANYHEEIISTISGYISGFQTIKESEKLKKSHEQEVCQIYTILETVISNLPNKIENSWEFKQIVGLLSRGILIENKPSVRQLAFRNVVLMVEFFFSNNSESELSEILYLLSCSINLSGFPSQSQAVVSNEVPTASDLSLLLVPRSQPPTITETIELYEWILDYISLPSHKPEIRLFWFENMRITYFTYLYPAILQEQYQFDLRKRSQSSCPYALHAVLIRKIYSWSNKPAIMNILWSDNYIPLMMELLVQTCQMPMEYIESILMFIETMHVTLILNPVFDIKSHQPLLDNFILLMLSSLNREVESKDVESMHRLISLVCDSLDVLTRRKEGENQALSDLLSIRLYRHLVGLITLFVSSNHSTLVGPARNYLDPLLGMLFNILFLIWIRSSVATEMWDLLKSDIRSFSNLASCLKSWNTVMLNLTQVLTSFLVAKDQTSSLLNRLGILIWHQDQAERCWLCFLNLFGNVNSIEPESNVEVFFNSIHACSKLLIEAHRVSKVSRPFKLFRIPDVYLYWLFGASEYFNSPSITKIVYQTLISILCNSPFHHLSVEIFAYFFYLIQEHLKNSSISVKNILISKSPAIFKDDLSRSLVLVPTFLSEILSYFSIYDNEPSLEIQKSSLDILGTFNFLMDNLSILSIADISNLCKVNKINLLQNIGTLYLTILSSTNSDSEILITALWYSCNLIFELAHTNHLNFDIVSGAFSRICDLLGNPTTALTAALVLSNLTMLTDKYQVFNKTLPINIIKVLLKAFIKYLSNFYSKSFDPIVVKLLYDSLNQLILCQPNQLLNDSAITLEVCKIMELGLIGELMTKEHMLNPIHHNFQSLASKIYLVDQLYASPTHNSKLISISAQELYITLFQSRNHYSTFQSAIAYEEKLSSNISTLYFSDANETLYAIQDVSSQSDPGQPKLVVRMTVRTLAGKFSWDFVMNQPETVLNIFHHNQDVPKELLINHDLMLSQPKEVAPSYMHHILTSSGLMEDLVNTKVSDSYDMQVHSKENVYEMAMLVKTIHKPYNETPSRFETSACRETHLLRQFLVNFGFLSPSNSKYNFLIDSSDLKDELEQLDAIEPRARSIFALNYIEYTSDIQASPISVNSLTETSILFQQFVHQLGLFHKTPGSNLDDHACVKLTTFNTEHNFFIYPLIHHEETIQEIQNNSLVELVWIEGDFNFQSYTPTFYPHSRLLAVIIINPTKSKLFRIMTYKANSTVIVAPLQEQVNISRASLVPLVIATCLTIHRLDSCKHYTIQHPISQRIDKISQIIQQYRRPMPEDVLDPYLYLHCISNSIDLSQLKTTVLSDEDNIEEIKINPMPTRTTSSMFPNKVNKGTYKASDMQSSEIHNSIMSVSTFKQSLDSTGLIKSKTSLSPVKAEATGTGAGTLNQKNNATNFNKLPPSPKLNLSSSHIVEEVSNLPIQSASSPSILLEQKSNDKHHYSQKNSTQSLSISSMPSISSLFNKELKLGIEDALLPINDAQEAMQTFLSMPSSSPPILHKDHNL